MAFFSSSFFVSVSSLSVALFRILYKVLLRFISDESSKMNSSCCHGVVPKEDSQIDSNDLIEKQAEPSSEILEETSKEESFGFTFKFPSYEEFSRRNQTEKTDSKLVSFKEEDEEESTSLIFLSKYDFHSSNNLRVFVDESSEAPSFSITETNEVTDKVQSGFLSEKDFGEDQKQFLHNEPTSTDSDTDSSDSITSSHEFSFVSHDFLSDVDFEPTTKKKTPSSSDILDELRRLEGKTHRNDNDNIENDDDTTKKPSPSSSSSDEDEDILDELRRLEGKTRRNDNDNIENDDDTTKNPSSSSSSSCDSEDSSALESLWEHQDLLEQLKMELKKVRATGLPTILEESSESPKISSDLRPWKIDVEKLWRRGDNLGELHKLYKSYRERMRKFDILNYQKMYALGFLQSKDPLQSFNSGGKSSAIWGRKRKKPRPSTDQMVDFVRELQGDLEMVYVGQLCLSWEFLQWQYEKVFEIWESDPHGFRQYNEVAGEFQQFQVLLNRFVENEPFQGPRVENYVKNRCIMRNILQVPVIREDSKETKKARRGSDHGAITCDMLFDVLEESIRTIWRFIRADKHANIALPKCRKLKEVELQDPADSDLLEQVQTELLKKDKKLKDMLRRGNCILKKFQKNQDEASDHLQFFSQVDLRLVARVLNMSRITTDQLVWCQSKLTKISFVNRKIHVEPSFLLFPC